MLGARGLVTVSVLGNIRKDYFGYVGGVGV